MKDKLTANGSGPEPASANGGIKKIRDGEAGGSTPIGRRYFDADRQRDAVGT